MFICVLQRLLRTRKDHWSDLLTADGSVFGWFMRSKNDAKSQNHWDESRYENGEIVELDFSDRIGKS